MFVFREMVDIEWFLRDLAEREAKAKVKLQVTFTDFSLLNCSLNQDFTQDHE